MRTAPLKLTASFICLTSMTACIGTDNPDFNQQARDGLQLINSFNELPVTPAGNIPTGSSTYTGVAGFNLDTLAVQGDQFELLADLEITADFDTNDITGNLSSFNTPDGNGTGTINLTNGAIVGNAFAVDANGNVGLPEGDSILLEVDMNGVFRGAAANAVTGNGSGSYTLESNGTSGPIFVQFGAD